MPEHDESGPERTFAFVDVAGFTALTEAHGDAEAADLVDRFVAVASAAVAGDGRVVKTIGDAVMLTFADPPAAVVALSRLFAASFVELHELVLRAGAHHGPAVERGGDYIGRTVNTAARVAEQAHGGQVLGTEPLAAAARAAGFGVVDLGSFALRNVVAPVVLYDLRFGPPVAGGAVDPVCRMWVERDRAAGRLRHDGADYWFCSLRCVQQFVDAPETYARPRPGT